MEQKYYPKAIFWNNPFDLLAFYYVHWKNFQEYWNTVWFIEIYPYLIFPFPDLKSFIQQHDSKNWNQWVK